MGYSKLSMFVTVLACSSFASSNMSEAKSYGPEPTRQVTPTGVPTTLWWGDFDADGRLDAYVKASGTGRLLRSLADGRFQDVTRGAGLNPLAAPDVAAWEDYDGDGRLDLFIGSERGECLLYHNLGNGTFEDVAVQAGLQHMGSHTLVDWIDYDLDGLSDLHVQLATHHIVYHNKGGGRFEIAELGDGTSRNDAVVVQGTLADTGAVPREPKATAAPRDKSPDVELPASADAAEARAPARVSTESGAGQRQTDAPGESDPDGGREALGGQPELDHASQIIPCAQRIVDVATGSCVRASSVPTVGMLYPLDDNFMIDPLGNMDLSGDLAVVGNVVIGGSSASSNAGPVTARLTAITDVAGEAIRGSSTATTGVSTGVRGAAASVEGTGVRGVASSTTGLTRGVHGVVASDAGEGVVGDADALTGSTRGVRGRSASDQGEGVRGEATSTTGAARGVCGVADSDAGEGVRGEASSVTGATRGVSGAVASIAGEGVVGEADSLTGATRGVRGRSASDQGEGIRGEATAGTGLTRGVCGVADSDAGEGVRGEASSMSGPTRGVCGLAASDAGEGVVGEADSLMGPTRGVRGRSASYQGEGVRGEATAPTGATRGVFGLTHSDWGDGVRGEASSMSGPTRGVYGFAASDAGEGVVGVAGSLTGPTRGVCGSSSSDQGEGVRGEATAVLGSTRGVFGVADSGTGEGVRGEATATSGMGRGVCGVSASNNGDGVYGEATGPGPARGVRGVALGSGGTGVHGEILDVGPGRGIGVFGKCQLANGLGVYGEAHGVQGVGVHGHAEGNDGKGVEGTADGDMAIGVEGSGVTGVRGVGNNPLGSAIGVHCQSNSMTGYAVYAENTATDPAAYAGGFDGRVHITGNVGIKTTTPNFALEVNGTAGKPGGGGWSNSSDRRLKKNVEDLEGALATLLELRGVSFEYKDPDAINELHGERIGFIAQEVEAVLPDWVDEGEDGYKRLTIRGFEALAVEALRELRDENQELRARVDRLTTLAEELETLKAQLRPLLE